MFCIFHFLKSEDADEMRMLCFFVNRSLTEKEESERAYLRGPLVSDSTMCINIIVEY